MHTRYITQQNQSGTDKPNEDYVLVDEAHHLYIVCDGVTRTLVNGRYPLPSPAAAASKRFAEAAHKVLLELLPDHPPRHCLEQAVTIGNEAVRDYNAQRFAHIDYLENDFAGTVAIIGLIKEDVFHYAYIGDCAGYLIRNSAVTAFTYPQTAQIALHYKQHKTVEIRRDIRNNKQHPYRYGVFTGEQSALDFVQYGEIHLEPDDKVALVSDGLAPYFDRALPLRPIAEIVAAMEQIEQAEQMRSDDKTMILLE